MQLVFIIYFLCFSQNIMCRPIPVKLRPALVNDYPAPLDSSKQESGELGYEAQIKVFSTKRTHRFLTTVDTRNSNKRKIKQSLSIYPKATYIPTTSLISSCTGTTPISSMLVCHFHTMCVGGQLRIPPYPTCCTSRVAPWGG